MTKELIDRVSGKVRRIVIKLSNGEDLDRFLTGETPLDISQTASSRVAPRGNRTGELEKRPDPRDERWRVW